jgi:Zn-dependent peptidase ImmA (M78 family)/transcriptional regulator with XRE-family HTH domain
MLTDFGIAVRKLRLDRGLKLRDMADKLDLTSAFVSAIETGRKPIPRGYVTAIAEALELPESEEAELQRAADKTRTTVHVDNLQADDRRLVASFARRVNALPPEVLENLKKFLKSLTGELPFRRRRNGVLVPPMSRSAIREFADQVRGVFTKDEQIKLPIIEILEFAMPRIFDGFYVDICDAKIMGDDEGRVEADSNCIMLREDVYDAACSGQGRARFTVCHEFGHFLLHRKIVMARSRQEHHHVYRDSEWQADFFAGCILLSKKHLSQFRDPDDAAKRCGMSREAARVMWTKLREAGV